MRKFLTVCFVGLLAAQASLAQSKKDADWMRKAFEQARQAVEAQDLGPFGAVVVRNGQKLGEGQIRVIRGKDPTAHAALQAVRAAVRHSGSADLKGAVLYSSSELCPMCLSAVYLANISRVFYGFGLSEGGDFTRNLVYLKQQISIPLEDRKVREMPVLRENALDLLEKSRSFLQQDFLLNPGTETD